MQSTKRTPQTKSEKPMLESLIRAYGLRPITLPPIRKTGRLYKNFQACPHCQHLGRRAEIDRLNESVPVICRSDGEKFHIILGDRPISYPSDDGSVGRMTAGFWYVRERKRIFSEVGEFLPVDGIPPTPASGTWACTEVTIVIFRPVGEGLVLMRQLELISDKLAEILEKSEFLKGVYELVGNRLHTEL